MILTSRDYDPATGMETIYRFNTRTGRLNVSEVQDVDPVLKNNREILNSKSSKSHKFNENEGLGTRVASIPTGLVRKWLSEGFNVFTCTEKQLHEKLNDPQYRKLRTSHGRL